MLWHQLILLGDNGAAAPAGEGGGGLTGMLILFLPIIVFFYLFMIRPQRREQQQRQKLLDGIKKNDRVLTRGGIFGVVTNVNRDAKEVTIKVDESTNTKLRMSIDAIGGIVGEQDTKES